MKRFVQRLTNEQVDIMAFECMKFYLIKKFHVRIDSWDKIMVIPERLLPVIQETTQGRVTKLPNLQKLIILKYCLNSPETFNMTFPFISGDEDLDMDT